MLGKKRWFWNLQFIPNIDRESKFYFRHMFFLYIIEYFYGKVSNIDFGLIKKIKVKIENPALCVTEFFIFYFIYLFYLLSVSL